MISHLVSSIFNPNAAAGAAEKAAAHQMDDDKNRPILSTGTMARPISAGLDRLSVDQGAAAERVDYFHAAKKMIRDALSDLDLSTVIVERSNLWTAEDVNAEV